MRTILKKDNRCILDKIPASDVITAISLRKLTKRNNRAIRVRRSLDNAETDIGYLGQNLNTNSLLRFCGAGSGDVTTIYSNNNSNHFIQTGSPYQARIVHNGVLQKSGTVPYLEFLNIGQGTDSFYRLSNFGQPDLGTNPVIDVICVISVPADGGTLLGGEPEGSMQFRVSGGGKLNLVYSWVTSLGDNNAIFPTNTFTLLSISINRSVFASWYNRVAKPNLSFTQNFANSGTILLGINTYVTQAFKGRLQECIVLKGNDNARRQMIEADITKYYSLS